MAGEIKQAVINQETVAAHHTPKRIRIKGFSGSYKGVMFDDLGQSMTAVDQEFIDSFHRDFPKSNAAIEEIADDTPVAKKVIPGTVMA